MKLLVAGADTLPALLPPRPQAVSQEMAEVRQLPAFPWGGFYGKGSPFRLSCVTDFGHFLGDGLRPGESGGRGGPFRAAQEEDV